MTFGWESPLRLKFPRLFELTVNKERTLEEMKRLGWGVEGGRGSGDTGC